MLRLASRGWRTAKLSIVLLSAFLSIAVALRLTTCTAASRNPATLSCNRRGFLSTLVPAAATMAAQPADSATTGKARQISVFNNSVVFLFGFTFLKTGVDGVARTRRETEMAVEMRDARTTVAELREKAEAGLPLPDVCIIKGTVRADSELMTPLVAQVDSLRGCIGTVDQPENMWLKAAEQLGRSKGGNSWLREATEQWFGDKLTPDDVAFAATGASGTPLAVDGASLTGRKADTAAASGGCVVTELLVTRLSVGACKGKKGVSRVSRFYSHNAHYVRQVSNGLHMVGEQGEQARIRLPAFDLRKGRPPPLFLPLADGFEEVSNNLNDFFGREEIVAPSSTHFTSVSPFVLADVSSQTDDGSTFSPNGTLSPNGIFGAIRVGDVALLRPYEVQEGVVEEVITDWKYSEKKFEVKVRWENGTLSDVLGPGDINLIPRRQTDSGQGAEPPLVHALDSLASASRSSEWIWNPVGYYDRAEYAGANESAVGANESAVVSYDTLKERMKPANSANANLTKYRKSGQTMAQLEAARDMEFGWRVSELAICNNTVVCVVGKPLFELWHAERPIVLVDPFDANVDGIISEEEQCAREKSPWRQDIVFLSESADDLIIQKTASANTYIGLAVVGALFTSNALQAIAYGLSHPESIVF